jgi:hypothetical protein
MWPIDVVNEPKYLSAARALTQVSQRKRIGAICGAWQPLLGVEALLNGLHRCPMDRPSGPWRL